MDWKTRIGLWWYDNVHFPLWHRFGSKESKREIKEALKKRREEGGCSEVDPIAWTVFLFFKL